MPDDPNKSRDPHVRTWWVLPTNDNQEGLPDSFPRYRCRITLAAVSFLAIQALTFMLVSWYQAELVRIGRELRIAPIDVQTASFFATVAIASVGTLVALMSAAWVIAGRARLLKYTCREWR